MFNPTVEHHQQNAGECQGDREQSGFEFAEAMSRRGDTSRIARAGHILLAL